MSEGKGSNSGNVPPILFHNHAETPYSLQKSIVDYFKEHDELQCSYDPIHKHGTFEHHHHHSANCLKDAGRNSLLEDFITLHHEVQALRHREKIMGQEMEHDQKARQSLMPLINLVAVWQEALPQQLATVEDVILEFSTIASHGVSKEIREKWLEGEREIRGMLDKNSSRD